MEQLLEIIEASIDYAENKINTERLSISTIKDYDTATVLLDCIKHGIKNIQLKNNH
jgi:hypothetical protein